MGKKRKDDQTEKITTKIKLDQRIHMESPTAVDFVSKILTENVPNDRDIVIFCVGTDRSTGDSLGPFTGTLLKDFNHPRLHIYGTLDDPVHAVNLDEMITKMKMETDENRFVIAIDACLGQECYIGYITFRDKPLEPGCGVDKVLTPIGDIRICGIVNIGGFMEYLVLQNTHFSVIYKMAHTIAQGIENWATYNLKLTEEDEIACSN